jgi:serine/threonine-protein kinase
VTAQSDVYSAAAVLWEALTCERLFHNVTWTNIAQVILHREAEAPSTAAPELPRELDDIVMRGLEKDPKKRFATAREMALTIEACIPLAPSHEVGEWVEHIAHAVLDDRAQKIAEIESRSSEAKMAASMALVQGPTKPIETEPVHEAAATRAESPWAGRKVESATREDLAEGSGGTQLTQISSHERAPSNGRGRWMAGVAALLALVFGAVGWLFAKGGSHAATHLPSPEPAPVAVVSPPSPIGIAPIAQAPSAVDPTDDEAPSAAAPSEPAPAPTAAPPATRVSQRRPIPPAPPPAVAAKRGPCNPPYVIDENRIRHIKPQCL